MCLSSAERWCAEEEAQELPMMCRTHPFSIMLWLGPWQNAVAGSRALLPWFKECWLSSGGGVFFLGRSFLGTVTIP